MVGREPGTGQPGAGSLLASRRRQARVRDDAEGKDLAGTLHMRARWLPATNHDPAALTCFSEFAELSRQLAAASPETLIPTIAHLRRETATAGPDGAGRRHQKLTSGKDTWSAGCAERRTGSGPAGNGPGVTSAPRPQACLTAAIFNVGRGLRAC